MATANMETVSGETVGIVVEGLVFGVIYPWLVDIGMS